MITIEDVKNWLDEKKVPYEVMIDTATRNEVYVINHYSQAAGIDYKVSLPCPQGGL